MRDPSRALAAFPALAALLASAPAPALTLTAGATIQIAWREPLALSAEGLVFRSTSVSAVEAPPLVRSASQAPAQWIDRLLEQPGIDRDDALLQAFRGGSAERSRHELRRLSRRQHHRPAPPAPTPAAPFEFDGRLEWRWDRFSFALVNFLGYDDLPHLKPVFYYDRNVDPRTGRPRIAGATGPCGRGFANEVAFRRNSMTAAGIGTDPDCLKGGGAPGFPNENRFRQAPDLNGDGRPDAAQIKDLIGLGGVLVVNGGFPDGTPDSVDLNGDGIPDDVDGDGKPDFFGFGATARQSGEPEHALSFSPANQQFFATVCSATVSIASQLEPGACAFNVFATPSPILQAGGFANFIFSEALSAFFSGEPDIGLARFMDLVVNTSIGLGPGGTQGTIPTRMLNRDRRLILDPTLLPPEFERRVGNFGDGVNTFSNVVSFNRTPTCLKPSNRSDPAGFVNPLASCVPDSAQDNIDWLSLDSALTSEQRALLGCGPFFGSRCDSSNRATNPLDSSIESFGFGGGIDFLHMEGSVLVQAWPGVEGTYTIRLKGRAPGRRWTTTDWQLIQPGTVGPDSQGSYVAFDGGPVATRYIPETGETVVLPGARGLASADAFRRAGLPADTPVLSLAPDESSITAVFEQGYNPVIDGCPLGNTMDGIPVVGVEVGTGASVDLSACGPSADSTALVAVYSGTRFRESQPGGTDLPAGAERGGASPLVQANVATLDGLQQVRRIDGSQALFHPLAGCFDDPSGPDQGLQCLIERNFESEFLDGLRGDPSSADPANEGRIASLFRTEQAAVSWNILQLLVVTSCNGDTDGFVGDPQGEAERLARPECFSPGIDPATGLRREWMADRCSFAAPQLCRNVQDSWDPPPLLARTDVAVEIVAGRVRTRGAKPTRWPLDVTVLGSRSVDVRRVAPDSLRLGPEGARPLDDLRLWREARWHLGDFNRDGFADLALTFNSRETGLARDDGAACLTGRLAGEPFLACSGIRVKVYKR